MDYKEVPSIDDNYHQNEEFDDFPSEYTYLFQEGDENQLKFRIKELKDEISVKKWIGEFSKSTKTTWRIARTHPEAGKCNVYKINLRCQHATDKRAKGIQPSKNTNCPASITITVKRYIKDSRSKNVDNLIEDWPAICFMKKQHNHEIDSAAALRHRDLGDESKEILYSLFRKGHSPSSALHCLKTHLLLKYGDEYFKIAADGFYVPSISATFRLFKAEFSSSYGSMDGPKMFESLENILKEYSDSSPGKAEFYRTSDNNHYFVVILTPIMLRAHESTQSGELVLIDASGGVDRQRHRIYFLVTPTAAGGLPLGVIITDAEKEDVFYEALLCLKNMLGANAFYGKGYPEVFLTDNDLKERKPLGLLFPKSKLLLCQFHFLKAVWSWLCNRHNGVESNQRQQLYFFVKNIMYAENEQKMIEMKTLMMSSEEFQKNEKFINYFLKLWNERTDWAICYRQNLLIRGTNTTNYVEVVFRILKDCILNRVMAFNLTQLVDFILIQYESYMQRRLIDFCNGRYSKSLLYKMLPLENTIPDNAIKAVENKAYCYTVESQACQGQQYFVDLLNAVCSCFVGQTGKICKHASAIIYRLSDELVTNYNLVCNFTKERIFYIATGNSTKSSWFAPLKQITSEEENCHFSSTVLNPIENVDNSNNIYPETTVSNEGSTDIGNNLALPVGNNAENEVPKESLTDEEIKELDHLFQNIKNGYKEEPNIFAPAIKKMLKNAKKYTSTQSGLISALYTFGMYNGAGKRKHHQNKHGHNIGVQPTSICRRKSLFCGKRKLSAGRPTTSVKKRSLLREHDYTSLGSLPSRKIKSKHNLQDCVYNNKSLGGRKHGKE